MSRVDPPGRKRTVLVVNDDSALQASFKELLSTDGFSVDCASSGPIAFEYLRRDSYAVILLDLTRPAVNGPGLLEQLERESPSLLRRVIVMAAGSQPVIDSVNTRRLWSVIRKPFEETDLLRAMRDCASGIRPGHRTGTADSASSARV